MASAFIEELRRRVGDTDPDPTKQLWSDDQLDEWIAQGMSEWTYGERVEASGTLSRDDIDQGLKLAHSSAMYELATGTVLFFKWRDQHKEMDKTMTPESCRRIGKDLWEQVNQHRKDREAKTDKDPQRKVAQGGVAQFDAGSTATARTPERPWY